MQYYVIVDSTIAGDCLVEFELAAWLRETRPSSSNNYEIGPDHRDSFDSPAFKPSTMRRDVVGLRRDAECT